MHLTHLRCHGFRCLKNIDLPLTPGITIIRGDNAQGKTSLLEAILFAATSKSHRTTTDADLVAFAEEGFSIHLQAARTQRSIQIDANYYRGAKRFKINGVAQTKVSDILGNVNVVFFSPEDMALIKSGAATRRKFIDMELSQIHPAYLNALQQYRQVLRQRNELLRKPRIQKDVVEVWDAQLVQYGQILISHRDAFIRELAPYAQKAYQEISDGENLQIKYRPDIPPGDSFDSLLDKTFDTDCKRGMTTRGPHRDEMSITIQDSPARSRASQGQQKSAALAIKLAELSLVKDRIGEYPVLMLDEVLSELDNKRANQLFDTIPHDVQCLITTTELEKDIIPSPLKAISILIQNGQITPMEPSDT